VTLLFVKEVESQRSEVRMILIADLLFDFGLPVFVHMSFNPGSRAREGVDFSGSHGVTAAAT